ncbi:serine O-acetyltransferase [Sinobaca sp. H24]|uniref:serine O-acetyltransferase n=1 Tax=Sinobaca sp. H24 TaxID=2923376 RepID=UPI002079E5D3|nr:serine acetyltransferase [Sinobaca sp. H24]
MKIKEIINQEINDGKKQNFLKSIYILYFSPKKRAVFIFRIAQELYKRGFKKISRLTINRLVTLFGTHISLTAEIGTNIEFRHINGVVIGDGVKIGNNVIIYQQVTLGGKNVGDKLTGNYPIIEDNVIIFSGAKIIGNVNIGKNSIVGTNSVVIKDVPPNSTVAGIPATIIKSNI